MPSVFALSWLVLSNLEMNMKTGLKGTHGGKYMEAQQKEGQESSLEGYV